MKFPDFQLFSPPLRLDPMQTRLAQELKHSSPLLCCRFAPAGRFVFFAAQDNSIQRWEPAANKKTPLAGHEGWVRSLAFHDKLLFSGDYHGKLLWWDSEAETPVPLRTVEAHDGWLRALAVSPDGKLLASCGNDNLVKLWSTTDGKLVATFVGHVRHAYNVAFHPDGKQLASIDLLGVVKHWEIATGKTVRDLDASVLHKYDPTFRASIGGARSMTFNAQGSVLACAGITNCSNAFAGVGNPTVVLFDWAKGIRLRLLATAQPFQGTMWGVAWHPEKLWIAAAGGSGGGLWFWKDDSDKSFHTVKLPNNGRDLALHPDGFRLAIPHADGAIRIYDLTAKG